MRHVTVALASVDQEVRIFKRILVPIDGSATAMHVLDDSIAVTLGSDAQRVLRETPVPILLVRTAARRVRRRKSAPPEPATANATRAPA